MSFFKLRKIEPKQMILEENDMPTELVFCLTGDVSVLKSEEEHKL